MAYDKGLPVFPHPGSDGLQVVSPDAAAGLEVSESFLAARHAEGLQTEPADTSYPIPYQGTAIHKSEKEAFILAGSTTDVESSVAQPKQASWVHNRKWWLVGAVAAIVVILVAVLGGVLGSKRSQSVSSPEQQSQGSGGSAADAANATTGTAERLRSASGAWNGTGMALTMDGSLGETSFLFFQDYSGKILSFVVNTSTLFDPSGAAPTLFKHSTVPIQAANGTGLTTMVWSNDTIPSALQLMYINQDGFLADVWQTSIPNGDWQEGTLHGHRIAAPTDNRPVMWNVKGSSFGIDAGTLGSRLFVGASDGHVHQYSFDIASWTWHPNATHVLTDSWAYGSIAANSNRDPKDNSDFTLFLSNQTGSIMNSNQAVKSQNNASTWPGTGSWSDPHFSNQQTSANSSVAFMFGDATDRLLFPHQDGKLGMLSLEKGGSDQHYLAYDSSLESHQGLQGTDFAFQTPISGGLLYNLVFYQEKGDSVSWLAIDGSKGGDGKFKGSGKLGLTSGDWGFTKD